MIKKKKRRVELLCSVYLLDTRLSAWMLPIARATIPSIATIGHTS